MIEWFIHPVPESGNTNKRQPHTLPVSPALTARVFRRIRQYYKRLFQNRNHIFIHKGPFETTNIEFCESVRFESFEKVPDFIRKAIEHNGSQKTLDADRLEIVQYADMWIAVIDQELAGVLFTRKGRNFRQWFVELKDDDIVIFRMRTYPKFRGRGIAPFLMHRAMKYYLTEGQHAYIDCRVYNTPSIRAIQKAGFELLTTMKPITRDFAMGNDIEKK